MNFHQIGWTFLWLCVTTLIVTVTRCTQASGSDDRSPTSQPTNLMTIQRGDLPIILSAPHGGRLAIPGATTREGRDSSTTKFTVVMDRNVDKLALRVADEIQKRTGKRPYVVVANFSRKFVDANRDPANASDSDAGQAVYEQYHAALAQARREIIKRFGRGFIIDLHGHGGDPNVIIRGSANWASVGHLTSQFGKDAIIGERGLLQPIAAAGFKLDPLNTQPDAPEFKSLDGGYITRHYGAADGASFDAIQLEFGLSQRTPEGIDRFAPVLADSLVQFAGRYLLSAAEPSTKP